MKKTLIVLSILFGLLLQSGCSGGSDADEKLNKTPYNTSNQNRTNRVKSDWTRNIDISLYDDYFYAKFYDGYPDEIKHNQIFIDIDKNSDTGYSGSNGWRISGADYIVSDNSIYKSLSNDSWDWEYIGEFEMFKYIDSEIIFKRPDFDFSSIFGDKSFKAMIELYDEDWNGYYSTITGIEIGDEVDDYKDDKNDNDKIIPNSGKKLLVPEDGKIYFGAYADFGSYEEEVSKEKIENFESLVGKKIAWAYFSNNWKNGIEYPSENIDTIKNSGKIPFVRLIPRSDDGYNEKNADPIYTMQNFIDGDFDDDLKQWAREAKAEETPILIDFACEMTGFWFPWSGLYSGAGTTDGYGDPDYPDGPERFRDAYRHIIDIFNEQGADNITWFFHPDLQRMPDEEWNSAKYYYPGDDYIDWIGVTLYGAQFEDETWVTFSDKLARYGYLMSEISDSKPVALLEMGVTDFRDEGTKSDWFEDAFATIKNNPYLRFSAITYWHESWTNPDGTYTSIKVDSSQDSLDTFTRLISDDDFVSEALFRE